MSLLVSLEKRVKGGGFLFVPGSFVQVGGKGSRGRTRMCLPRHSFLATPNSKRLVSEVWMVYSYL